MIDRPNLRKSRKSRTAAERHQLRAVATLSLGAALLLSPLLVPAAARQGVDVLHTAGWLLLALGALWQWRLPRVTPAALACADEAERIAHRRVRHLPESAIGAWRAQGGR